jgi:16S rRNA (cytidine1402-2'-O)-methyltransferase
VLSFFEGNEEGRVRQLIAHLRAGSDVLIVTDSGMPSVSDPGYRMVAAALADGIPVTVLPGPSAVTTAIAISGLPVDRFTFEGFLPRKGRAKVLAQLASETRTMVFFESPRRLGATLREFADTFGPDRSAAVCRELTKTYEEVKRGTLAQLAEWAAGEVRGEITVVVRGAAGHASNYTAAELAEMVSARESEGASRKIAIATVAANVGIPKRQVFDALISAKSSTGLLG